MGWGWTNPFKAAKKAVKLTKKLIKKSSLVSDDIIDTVIKVSAPFDPVTSAAARAVHKQEKQARDRIQKAVKDVNSSFNGTVGEVRRSLKKLDDVRERAQGSIRDFDMGDLMSGFGPIDTALEVITGKSLDESFGTGDFFQRANEEFSFKDVANNVGQAVVRKIEADFYASDPVLLIMKWDDFKRQQFGANHDWTQAHPGITHTKEIVVAELGPNIKNAIPELAQMVGTIAYWTGGPIAGVIAGAAAGWGLYSQFGAVDDYDNAFKSALIGALAGVGLALPIGWFGIERDMVRRIVEAAENAYDEATLEDLFDMKTPSPKLYRRRSNIIGTGLKGLTIE